MIAPIIDELAGEYKEKLKVHQLHCGGGYGADALFLLCCLQCVKLNTDESPQVATDYGIRSIPTVCALAGLPKMLSVHKMAPVI